MYVINNLENIAKKNYTLLLLLLYSTGTLYFTGFEIYKRNISLYKNLTIPTLSFELINKLIIKYNFKKKV